MIGILNFTLQAAMKHGNKDNNFKTNHLNQIIIQNEVNNLEKCNFDCDEPLKIK